MGDGVVVLENDHRSLVPCSQAQPSHMPATSGNSLSRSQSYSKLYKAVSVYCKKIRNILWIIEGLVVEYLNNPLNPKFLQDKRGSFSYLPFSINS